MSILDELVPVAGEIQDKCVLVNQAHVHKAFDKNRLLAWLRCDQDKDGLDVYRAKVRIIPDHTYFFEHNQSHLPGLYIIEAGRQLGLAVPHIYLDVGYDYAFVLDGCEMSFMGFANLSDDLFVESRILNPVYRKKRLHSLTFDGKFIQNDVQLVRYQSHIRLVHERMLKRYEKKSA